MSRLEGAFPGHLWVHIRMIAATAARIEAEIKVEAALERVLVPPARGLPHGAQLIVILRYCEHTAMPKLRQGGGGGEGMRGRSGEGSRSEGGVARAA